MKKIAIMFYVIVLQLLLLGCASVDQVSQKIIDDISAIGDVDLDLEDEDQILKTLEVYESLTDNQKSQIKNYTKLIEAKAIIDNLKLEKAKEEEKENRAKELEEKIKKELIEREKVKLKFINYAPLLDSKSLTGKYMPYSYLNTDRVDGVYITNDNIVLYKESHDGVVSTETKGYSVDNKILKLDSPNNLQYSNEYILYKNYLLEKQVAFEQKIEGNDLTGLKLTTNSGYKKFENSYQYSSANNTVVGEYYWDGEILEFHQYDKSINEQYIVFEGYAHDFIVKDIYYNIMEQELPVVGISSKYFLNKFDSVCESSFKNTKMYADVSEYGSYFRFGIIAKTGEKLPIELSFNNDKNGNLKEVLLKISDNNYSSFSESFIKGAFQTIACELIKTCEPMSEDKAENIRDDVYEGNSQLLNNVYNIEYSDKGSGLYIITIINNSLENSSTEENPNKILGEDSKNELKESEQGDITGGGYLPEDNPAVGDHYDE